MSGDLTSKNRTRLSVGERLRAARAMLDEKHGGSNDVLTPATGPAVLSYEQRRVWLVDRILGGSPDYNVPYGFRITGAFDVAAFERALRVTVTRHAVLRTRVEQRDGAPRAVVAPPERVPVSVRDLRHLETAAAPEIAAAVRAEINRPFDLGTEPPTRSAVLRCPGDTWIVLVTVHHIATDGPSTELIWRELSEAYRRAAAGLPDRTDRPPLCYADFAAWEQHSTGPSAHLRYWSDTLANVVELDLPADRPRLATPTRRGAEIPFVVPPDVAARIRGAGARHGASVFMTLLAGFAAVLRALSGQDDITVGTPIVGRTRPELETVIGSFVNMLVLRIDLSGQPNFGELIQRVRDTTLAAFAHQETPFAKLVEYLRPQRSLNRNPLFGVSFTVTDRSAAAFTGPGLTAEPMDLPTDWAKFDLSAALVTGAADGAIHGSLSYATDLFDAATVEHIAALYLRIIDMATTAPARSVAELPLLGAAEASGVRGQDLDLDGRTLPDLITAQAARTPDAPAVGSGTTVLTYAQVLTRAAALASTLRANGVAPEDAVGVCLERTPELVVALLGVWLADACYVPIDPSYGAGRIEYMIRSSGARTVLVDAPSTDAVDWAALGAHAVDVAELATKGKEAAPPAGHAGTDARVARQRLAYLIFTSGSTGRPKGVLVTHGGVANFARDLIGRTGLGPSVRVAAVTTVSFDIAVLELLVPLAAGAHVELVPRAVATDGEKLGRLIARQRVDVVQATPTGWAMLIESGWRGAPVYALCGGEALPASLARRIRSRVQRLWNVYGPTETTIWSTAQEITAAPSVHTDPPLGEPLANTTLYILDSCGNPLPRGAVGELYIGGAGLARGYVNDPAATAFRFRPDPFDGTPGARLYGTGDLVRRRTDGSLEFLGRADNQVKVRGHRIEPGEIESRLLEHPAVSQAVVQARGTGADRYLAVWLVWRANATTTWPGLRAHLLANLPEYMVPTRIVELDRLPTTPSGKIDRQALPEPERVVAAEPAAPRTDLERRIADVWQRVLGVPRIGAHDNFFELGGHSLRATRAAALLRSDLSAEVPVQSLFTHPTVHGLAALLDQRTIEPVERIRPRHGAGPAPLSFAQQRLWFLDRLTPGRADYNVFSTVRLRGPLKPAALHEALLSVVRRHEVLRSRFTEGPAGPVQSPGPVPPLWTAPTDLRDHGLDAVRLAAERIQHAVAQPFDLARGPLVRAMLLRVGDDDHLLSLVMHHAVVDGWSLPILWRELSDGYRAQLTGTTSGDGGDRLQYADFAAWERQQDGGFDEDMAYWRALLDGAVPTEITGTRARPAEFDSAGSSVPFQVDAQLGRRVTELATTAAATPFMVLCGAFMVTVGLMSNMDDVVIGTPIAGRGRDIPELAGVLGPFLNTVVLRAELGADDGFSGLLTVLRQRVAEAHAHQDLPFEALVERLRPERDLSRHPLFQIMFSLDEDDAAHVDLPGITAAWCAITPRHTKVDLSMSLMPDGDGFTGSLLYASASYDHALAESLVTLYLRVLTAVTTQPDTRFADLELAGVEGSRGDMAAGAEDGGCLHELVEAVAERRPDATAVVAGDETVSFAELDRRAEKLAAWLRQEGAGPGVPVAVLMPRSVGLVAALLGVLKSGAICVPLDDRQPAERNRALLKGAEAAYLVASRDRAHLASSVGAQLIDIRRVPGATLPGGWRMGAVVPADIAYLTHTSGSTGQPKKVPTTHTAAVSYLNHLVAEYQLGERDVVLQLAAVSFDAAIRDIFGTLAAGAKLVLLQEEAVGDPRAVLAEAARQGVTALLSVVPSFLAVLTTAPHTDTGSIRLILTSGEVLLPGVAQAAGKLGPAVEVVNQYGPTECTMTATFHRVTGADHAAARVPIGTPLPGNRTVVLGKGGRRLPAGAVGELYIGGPRVSAGYLGDPRLTAERFVPDPFGPPGSRLYRTGDLARGGPGGRLEFLGRADDQVKVRGVRVEPGEIESFLSRLPEVKAAAVVPTGPAGAVRLVAYVVTAGAERNLAALRRAANRALPEQLRPAAYVSLDELPTNAHGKVDRTALARRPVVPDAARAASYTAPRDRVELELARIWEDVLEQHPVGIREDFFDLGGHSLKAVELVDEVARRTGVRVPLNAVFLHRTVEGLAAVVTKLRGGASPGSLLVPLCESPNGEPPLFLVHPQSGDACCYVDMVRELGTWRTVYGIEAVGYNGDDPPLTDLLPVAERYVREIRLVAPRGPYLLAGWSFGANVALEMTALLEAEGETIAFLGAIDARAFGADDAEEWYERTAEPARFGLVHGMASDELTDTDQATILALLTRRLTGEGKLPEAAGLATLRRMFAVFNANGRAADTYRPTGAVRADIWLFMAQGRHATLPNPKVVPASWQARTEGELHVLAVPGNHHDLLARPHAAEFASSLRAAVDTAVGSGLASLSTGNRSAM